MFIFLGYQAQCAFRSVKGDMRLIRIWELNQATRASRRQKEKQKDIVVTLLRIFKSNIVTLEVDVVVPRPFSLQCCNVLHQYRDTLAMFIYSSLSFLGFDVDNFETFRFRFGQFLVQTHYIPMYLLCIQGFFF